MRKIIASVFAVLTIFTCCLMTTTKTNAAVYSVESFVKRLYKVCLDRDADAAGLNEWSSLLKTKKATGISASYGFVFSNEFQSKNCSNEEFVTYMYNAFFGRQPDAVGLQGWVDALNQGYSRERVFCGFANSNEFAMLCNDYGIVRGYHIEGSNYSQTGQVNLFVDRLYSEVLKRPCDPQGMADWTTVLVNGSATGAQAAYGFVFSPEFTSKNYCNYCYVEVLYKAFLGRSYDYNGRQAWVDTLDKGATREEVFNGFVGSDEFIQICSTYGIQNGSLNSSSKTYSNGVCSKCSRTSFNGQIAEGLRVEGGVTYCYSNGYKYKGWKNLNGKWYFFGDDYKYQKKTGFIENNYGTFYLLDDGTPVKGWQKINGKSYYFWTDTGELYRYTGWRWLEDDEQYYYFNDDHQWVVKPYFQLINDDWYFFTFNGTMLTGWIDYLDNKFYFDPSGYYNEKGRMVTGFQTIKDKKYYFEDSGALLKPNQWYTIDGNRYYTNSDGSLAVGFYQIGNHKYFFYKDGTMVTGFVSISLYYMKDGNLIGSGKSGSYLFNDKGENIAYPGQTVEIDGATVRFRENGSINAYQVKGIFKDGPTSLGQTIVYDYDLYLKNGGI
ncbi:MAG: DUF4214 domain-containing protein [Saccharofermentans sp.]|nr:DUF4214 domain-containing protein [Saccharofermentans sp.]